MAAHVLLRELGIPFKAVVMTYTERGVAAVDGSVSAEEYLTIHPNGQVPALKVDDEVITENPAILGFIASLAPERKLLGKSRLENARTAEWMAFLSGSLHGWGYGMIFRPGRYTDNEAHYDMVVGRGKAKVASCYALVEQRLKGKTFPVGDAATTADFYLIPFYYWGLKNDIDMSLYPSYGNHIKRMEENEHVQAVLKEEGVPRAFV